jgi:ribose 5-phosphate isomerase A
VIVEDGLRSLGASDLTLRSGSGKHGPTITERGNIIIDAAFSDVTADLEARVKSLVGVVESGLFIGYAHEVLLASAAGLRSL